MQIQLAIHEIPLLNKEQAEFIAPYLISPLTFDELKTLFQLAHSASRGENPTLSSEIGEILIKLLDEQSPKEEHG